MSVKQFACIFHLFRDLDTTAEYFKIPQQHVTPNIWKVAKYYGGENVTFTSERLSELLGTFKSTLTLYLGNMAQSGFINTPRGWIFNIESIPTSNQLTWLFAMAPITCDELHVKSDDQIYEYISGLYGFSPKFQSTIRALAQSVIVALRSVHSLSGLPCSDPRVRGTVQGVTSQIISPDNPNFNPGPCGICSRINKGAS